MNTISNTHQLRPRPMNGNPTLKVAVRGVVQFLLITSCFLGVANASDFAMGVATGMALSDSPSKKDEGLKEPEEIIQYEGDGEHPVIFRTKTYLPRSWKKLEGPDGGYRICDGGEYRWNAGGRCRVPDQGFNGVMGGYRDAKDMPIEAALEKDAGKPIALKTIEHRGDSLVVKYRVIEPMEQQKPTTGSDIANAAVKGFVQGVENAAQSPDVSPKSADPQAKGELYAGQTFEPLATVMLDTMESMGKILGPIMIIVGLAMGVARQSFSSTIISVAGGISLIQMPTVMKAIIADTGSVPDQAASQSELGGGAVLILLAIGVLVFVGYKIWSVIENRRLDLVLEQVRFETGGEIRRRPNDRTPPSVEELQQRQENSTSNTPAEPRVISQESAPTVEIKKNQRKIVLD